MRGELPAKWNWPSSPASHGEVIAVLFDFEVLGRPERGLDFAREAAFFVAELERGHAIAVEGDVGVGRIGVQRRTHHKKRLAMRIHAFADKLNVRLEKTVAGNFYPDKVEIVFIEPDIFAAGGDGVGFVRGIVNGFAWMKQDADVAFVFEDAKAAGRLLGGAFLREGEKQKGEEK